MLHFPAFRLFTKDVVGLCVEMFNAKGVILSSLPGRKEVIVGPGDWVGPAVAGVLLTIQKQAPP